MSPLTALGDPIRARIVELLATRDLSVGEIGEHFPISQPGVSRHLRVLRGVRLVQFRERGQQRIYSIDPNGFDDVEKWVATCRKVWSARLDALAHHLDAVAARDSKGDKR
jgi:DNA-binding transcriptional ArsR family regulator